LRVFHQALGASAANIRVAFTEIPERELREPSSEGLYLLREVSVLHSTKSHKGN